MIYVGSFSLMAAALVAIYICVSLYSWLNDKRRNHPYDKIYAAIIGVFGLVSLATLALVLAFIKQDYSIDYVAKYSSPEMAMYLKLAAIWAGQAGSMLFWLFLLSGFTALIAYRRMKEPDTLTNYALLILTVVELFFLAILILVRSSNPFIPGTGGGPSGLNPLLQHWAMVLHPPTLFIGYAGFTIPFAYALAALLAKDSTSEWVNRTHKWTLFSWLFLSLGIILGALWAYVVLGWGGYWGWDPVENASLVPWLTGIALMHSFTAYRRRGNLKIWTAALAVTTFILCIVATFITRSGLIQSVHAYERDPLLTTLFAGFMLATIGISYHLMTTNRERFAQQDNFESFISKQFTYYLNNIVMVAFAAIVLFATAILPFFGRTWSADNYNMIARPLGILYLLLLIACPLFGWIKTEKEQLYRRLMVPGVVTLAAAIPIWFAWNPGKPPITIMDAKIIGFIGMLLALFLGVSVIELFVVGAQVKAKNRGIGFFSALFSIFRNNRSTAGGYITHLGIAIAMFGVVGSTMYISETQSNFSLSQSGWVTSLANYQLKYKKFDKADEGAIVSERAYFDVYKDGRRLGEIAPKIAFFKLQQQSTRQVAVVGASAVFNPSDLKLRGGNALTAYNPVEDLFVSINSDQNNPNNVSIEIKVNPLISLVWLGSIILTLGTILAYWPKGMAVPVAEEKKAKAKAGRVPVEA
ncbi:MAG: cytochrome c biogenesis protein CcsA [Actinobacteria bacterium]|nr:cytochrome c biogenesis protein CcsA [Actinomycetota bacterium]